MSHPTTLTGARKAASLLIALGTESASKLMTRLPAETVDPIALELFRTPQLDPGVRDAVLEETFAGLIAQTGVIAGGEQYALELFAQAFGESKARELIERVMQSQVALPFEFLSTMDPIQVKELLQTEHPQTVALVLAHLDARTAARVLGEFDPALQAEVARRIAITEQTTPEALQVVEEGLLRRMSSVVTEVSTVGGVRPLAHVLNQVDRTTERQILTALSEKDHDLAEEVRRLMFVFEDIVQLDDRSMQRVIRELDPKDVALALRGVSPEVKDKFLKNMSQRAAEMLKEEMGLAQGVRMKNVEEAQGRIVAVIKNLESQDEIVIQRGDSGDDVLV